MGPPVDKSSLENFSASPGALPATRKPGEPFLILTERQWLGWQEDGYLIVPQAVPATNIQAVVDLIWEFQEMDPQNPNTWYRNPAASMQMKELVNSGMVEVYNHQALWNNRQHPRVHQIFADIWGTPKLWVSIDRANLSAPVRRESPFKGFIHWDIDTSQEPLPFNVQGVLALTDTTSDSGGFQCVPEIFRGFDEWVKTQPPDRDPWVPDITGYPVRPVPLKAGDLLVWNSLLPHGIRPNRSRSTVRMAQYISMSPAREEDEELVRWRIRSWKERIAPTGHAFPGDPRNWEQKFAETASLTPLGERLLGLKRWK